MLFSLLAQVCTYIAKCYAVAAQFEGCREKIQEHSAIIKDLCRILYYKVSKASTDVYNDKWFPNKQFGRH